jgi:hypothetical protein
MPAPARSATIFFTTLASLIRAKKPRRDSPCQENRNAATWGKFRDGSNQK